MSEDLDIEYVGQLPEPKRASISLRTVEMLREKPGTPDDPGEGWHLIASEEKMPSTTVKSRSITLKQFARRHEYPVEVSERTEEGVLRVYARWVST